MIYLIHGNQHSQHSKSLKKKKREDVQNKKLIASPCDYLETRIFRVFVVLVLHGQPL